MNKSVLTEELNRVGIIINSFEFNTDGYVLELKLNPSKATGWEVLENLPIVGVELVKTKYTETYSRKVIFIPSNGKEFTDYIRKHMKNYGLGRKEAVSDLRETVDSLGTRQIKIALEEYLKRSTSRG